MNVKELSRDEYFYGHKACAGCGGALAVRIALKVLGKRAFAALPAGCMSAVGFNFPQLCFSNNAIISTFAGTASMLTGMEAGLRALGRVADGRPNENSTEDSPLRWGGLLPPDDGDPPYTVVGFAGDGGTADIGIQALSGALDRNDDILYVCYDNEAYMNTGVQKSGLSPFGAQTTTTPAGKRIHGNTRPKKSMFEIVAAHGAVYAATASVGYLNDYMNKVEKAKGICGTKYIHVIAPCPVGWGTKTDVTVELAKQVVDTGLWPLAEYEDGRFRLTRKKPEPFAEIEDYLKQQSRFRHLTEEDIAQIKAARDARWAHTWQEWG